MHTTVYYEISVSCGWMMTVQLGSIADVLCSHLFPELKPFAERTPEDLARAGLLPAQGAGPSGTGQRYAELHLEDILGPQVTPAGADAADLSAPASSTLPGPPQDFRRGIMNQQSGQAPSSTTASAMPTQPASAPVYTPPQDPRRSNMHAQPEQRHAGHGDNVSSAAAGDQSASLPLQAPPLDPRRAALAPQHAQHASLDPRKQQGSAMHQASLASPSTSIVTDPRQQDSAATPPASESLPGSIGKHEDDSVEELLYSSAPEQGRAASQAKQAQQQSVRRRGEGDSESHAAAEGLTEQLLYDDPFLLKGEKVEARSSQGGDKHIADGLIPTEFIPGLGGPDAHASDRHKLSHESVLTASSTPAGLRPGIPAGVAPGMPARDSRIEAIPRSEHASMSLHAGAVESQPYWDGAEGSAQVARQPQPVTVQPPGRLQSLQQGSPKPFTLSPPGRPMPITLKPPAAARQGGGNFRAHTMEYRR